LRKTEPESAASILKRLTEDSNLGKLLDQALVWERWPEIAGKRLAPHGHPVGFRDRTLLIAAESPVWMNVFSFQRFAIIGRVNRLVGYELVSDVFISDQPEGPPQTPPP